MRRAMSRRCESSMPACVKAVATAQMLKSERHATKNVHLGDIHGADNIVVAEHFRIFRAHARFDIAEECFLGDESTPRYGEFFNSINAVQGACVTAEIEAEANKRQYSPILEYSKCSMRQLSIRGSHSAVFQYVKVRSRRIRLTCCAQRRIMQYKVSRIRVNARYLGMKRLRGFNHYG